MGYLHTGPLTHSRFAPAPSTLERPPPTAAPLSTLSLVPLTEPLLSACPVEGHVWCRPPPHQPRMPRGPPGPRDTPTSL